MLKQKRPVPQEAEEEHELQLSRDLSFLDAIAEACKRNERCTLVARSEGGTIAALVDRAGPFSISGPGVSGVDALTLTASLHSGTYTVTDGWTVVQPLFQPGLDAAFRSLTGAGNGNGNGQALPRARGVDAIRDAIRSAGVGANPFVQVAEGSFPPVPFDAAALAALHPVATAAPAPVAFPPPPATAPEPPVAPVPPVPPVPAADPVGALAVDVAVREPEALSRPVAVVPEPQLEAPVASAEVIPAEPRTDSALHARASFTIVHPAPRQPDAGGEDLVDYLRSAATRAKPQDPEAEGSTPQPRSAASRLATRFLLWMVYAEGDPEEFTLGEATGLVGQELTDAASGAMGRLLGGFNRRWESTRDDWRRSGELAARDRAERARKARNRER